MARIDPRRNAPLEALEEAGDAHRAPGRALCITSAEIDHSTEQDIPGIRGRMTGASTEPRPRAR